MSLSYDSQNNKDYPFLYTPIINNYDSLDIKTLVYECERTYYKLTSNMAVHRSDRYTSVTAAYICFMVDITLSENNVNREKRAEVYSAIVNMMTKLDILDSSQNEVFISCFSILSKVATGELCPHGKWMTSNAEGNDRQIDWSFDNFLCYGDLLKYPSCRKDYLAPPSELPDPLSDAEFAAEFGKTHSDIAEFLKVISFGQVKPTSAGSPKTPPKSYTVDEETLKAFFDGQDIRHDREEKPKEYSMKYYKFLVYFLFFASAVINILSALNFFTGSSLEPHKDMIYLVYPGLEALNICLGVAAIGFAILALLSRYALYHKKALSIKAIPCFYILSGIVHLLECLAVNSIVTDTTIKIHDMEIALDIGTVPSSIVLAFGSFMLAWINYEYISKRRELFVN